MKEGAAKDYEWEDGWIERRGNNCLLSFSILYLCLFFPPSRLSEGACWREGTSLSN